MSECTCGHCQHIKAMQRASSFAAPAGSDADRDFEAWWARNCYSIRDMIAGEVSGSSGRLRNACLKVWSASREHPNDKAHL